MALLMDCTCVTKLPALPGSHSETSGMSVLRVDVCPLTSAGHPLDAFRGASEGFQLIRITKFLKKKKILGQTSPPSPSVGNVVCSRVMGKHCF